MEGARAADDEKAVGFAHDDFNGIATALDNGLQRGLGDRDLGEKKLRWDERILAEDWGFLVSCEFLENENELCLDWGGGWRGQNSKHTAGVICGKRLHVENWHDEGFGG